MRALTLTTLLASLSTVTGSPVKPGPDHSPNTPPQYIDWRTFHARGVNLGGWLEQESTIDVPWWDKYSHGASDEWHMCTNLGAQCASVFEHRYATFVTTQDIDKLAAAGITMLRIPTTYAAWIHVPGSGLYRGSQQEHLRRITNYAIEKHNMHVVVDIHSLPGGTNGLDIGERVGHWGWWGNETNLAYSLEAVDQLIQFVQNSGHPESFSIEPINEPADNHNFEYFGTPEALSEDGAKWLLKYFHAVLEHVERVNPKIPVFIQGSFKPETYWSPHFAKGKNMVFDLHHYYWQYDNSTSANLPTFICKDAKASKGDGKFPTFVGEWAMEAGLDNKLALRKRNLVAGTSAFAQYTHGSSYWNFKFISNVTVPGSGAKGEYQDYWSYEELIDAGYTDGLVNVPDYCK